MGRRFNPRAVKTHRAYRIDELANAVGVTPQTVRSWCKEGLPCLTDARPFLIRGRDFKEFHEARRARRSCKLGVFEMLCLSCKGPRKSEPGLVELETSAGGRPRVAALCPSCGTIMRRFIRRADLPVWAAAFGFACNVREDA